MEGILLYLVTVRLDVPEKLVFGRYFRMVLKVVDHLAEIVR